MAVSTKNNRALRIAGLWLPVAVCMGLIFYASSKPGSDIPLLFPFQDVLFHGIIYGTLALLFARAMKKNCPEFVFGELFLVTVLFAGFYGVSDEFHQIFVPGRDCSTIDLLIDLAGSCLGGLIGGKIF